MDRFSSLQEVSLGELFIQTTRYEEYQAGKMISSGTTSALIKYTTLEDGRIKVIIGNYWCPLNFKRHDKTLRNASKHGVADSFFKTKPP